MQSIVTKSECLPIKTMLFLQPHGEVAAGGRRHQTENFSENASSLHGRDTKAIKAKSRNPDGGIAFLNDSKTVETSPMDIKASTSAQKTRYNHAQADFESGMQVITWI